MSQIFLNIKLFPALWTGSLLRPFGFTFYFPREITILVTHAFAALRTTILLIGPIGLKWISANETVLLIFHYPSAPEAIRK